MNRKTTNHHPSRLGTRLARLAAVGCLAAVVVGAATPAAEARRKVRTSTEYSVAVVPDAYSVNAGSAVSFPVYVRTTGGYAPSLRWEVDGIPDAFDVSVRKVSTNRYRLDVAVPSNSPSSNGVYQLFGVNGSRERMALFRLQVNGSAPVVTFPPVTQPPVTFPPVTQPPATTVVAPNFGLRLDNPDLTVTTNQTAVFGLTIDRSFGYTGPVTFALSGLPVGATANFAPNPTLASTNLYITAGAATATGRYPISVSAVAGSTVRTGTVALNVTAVSEFQLVASTPILTLNQPGKASTTIEIRKTGPVTPTVTFSVTGLPTATTYTFSANPSNKNVTFSAVTTSSTPPGIYNLAVVGKSGQYTQTTNVQLVVNNPVGFTIAASPSDLGIARGSGASTFVTLKSFGGFNGNVTLSVSGLPTGVTLRTGSTTATAGTTLALIFDVAAGAPQTPTGVPTQVFITGTSGAYTATVKVNVAVI